MPGTTSSTPATSTTTTTPPTSAALPTTTTLDVFAPEGSGCTPGTDVLPDGVWYGLVTDFDDDGISFDLACWFSGDAATAAAAQDGEESPSPNDYFVRNQNEQLRELEVAPDTPVLWYLSGDPSDSQQGTFSEWVDFLETQDFRREADHRSQAGRARAFVHGSSGYRLQSDGTTPETRCGRDRRAD